MEVTKLENLAKEYDEQISAIISILESSKFGGVEFSLQKIELSKVRVIQSVKLCKKADSKRVEIYDKYTELLEEFVR